jgi:hypothetical protein
MRIVLFLFITLAAAVNSSAWAACEKNCGDKCTRKSFFGQYRDPACYTACEIEKQTCERTGIDVKFPDIPGEIEKVSRSACGLPHQVTLQYNSSVCGFAPSSASDITKIDAAKQLLIKYGLVKNEEFGEVQIFFCDKVHGGGIVPDRDLVYINSMYRQADVKSLAVLLAHEMTHVRQYRREGTDNFKCNYTRQVGDCLVSNITRGIGNLLRDGFCQTGGQNAYEKEAYDYQALADKELALQPVPVAEKARSLFCQAGKNYHCRFEAYAINLPCQCPKNLTWGDRPYGPGNLSGRTVEDPEGQLGE